MAKKCFGLYIWFMKPTPLEPMTRPVVEAIIKECRAALSGMGGVVPYPDDHPQVPKIKEQIERLENLLKKIQ